MAKTSSSAKRVTTRSVTRSRPIVPVQTQTPAVTQMRESAQPVVQSLSSPTVAAPSSGAGFKAAVIVIIAIVAIAALLFFVNRSVGNAVFTNEQGTAGLSLYDSDYRLVQGEQVVAAGTVFSLPVDINVPAARAVGLTFTMELPEGVSCDDFTFRSSVGAQIRSVGAQIRDDNIVVDESECVGNQLMYEFGVLDPDNGLSAAANGGMLRVGLLIFESGLSAREQPYEFTFPDFFVHNIDNNDNLVSTALDYSLTVQGVQDDEEPPEGPPQCQDQCPAEGFSCLGQSTERECVRNPESGCIEQVPGTLRSCIDPETQELNACINARCGDGGEEPSVVDTDGDGASDITDSCVDVPNPDQANLDGDAYGDLCDPDMDNDGVANALDECPLLSQKQTLPCEGDVIVLPDQECRADNLAGCASVQECEEAGLNWYDFTCHVEEEPAPDQCTAFTMDACVSEEQCTSASLYWYNDQCNAVAEELVDDGNGGDEESPDAGIMMGVKVSAGSLPPSGTVYITLITATEDIDTAFQVFTTLIGSDGNVVFESRNIASMSSGETIEIRTDSLGKAVTQKRVVIYDTPDPSQWTIHLDEPLVTNYDAGLVG